MAEPAVRLMTLDEFFRWEDDTDARYQLIEGAPVAVAPPAPRHGILAVAPGAELRSALRSKRPCIAQSEAGIAIRSGMIRVTLPTLR
jgi:Uma2 family endonuclease